MNRKPKYTYPLRCQLTVGIDEPGWQQVLGCLGKPGMVVGVKATEDSRVIMCEAMDIPRVCGKACPAHQQFIKNLLCVERSAMSVEISKLRREGIIECDKSRFKLKSPSSE